MQCKTFVWCAFWRVGDGLQRAEQKRVLRELAVALVNCVWWSGGVEDTCILCHEESREWSPAERALKGRPGRRAGVMCEPPVRYLLLQRQKQLRGSSESPTAVKKAPYRTASSQMGSQRRPVVRAAASRSFASSCTHGSELGIHASLY